jgi:hypothetical protein
MALEVASLFTYWIFILWSIVTQVLIDMASMVENGGMRFSFQLLVNDD